MCYTGPDTLDLTRATLIDSQGHVILDELCLPDTPITDYNTRYSGITAAMLAHVTQSWREVRAKILSYVDRDTYLVGHALDNDLHQLRIAHRRVLDSQLLYSTALGRSYRPALKKLAWKHLKRAI